VCIEEKEKEEEEEEDEEEEEEEEEDDLQQQHLVATNFAKLMVCWTKNGIDLFSFK